MKFGNNIFLVVIILNEEMGGLVKASVGEEEDSFEGRPPKLKLSYQVVSRRGRPRVIIERKMMRILLGMLLEMV